jgi:hypothetical protein
LKIKKALDELEEEYHVIEKASENETQYDIIVILENEKHMILETSKKII